MGEVTGYMHPFYAHSLSSFGDVVELPRSGGYLIKRDVPGTKYKDAIGPYPLFVCQDWMGLEKDLNNLTNTVSVVAVVPPLIGADVSGFDFARPFKEHYYIDINDITVCENHRRNVEKAYKHVMVREVKLSRWLPQWRKLYTELVIRHNITGMADLPAHAFWMQAIVPGLFTVAALKDNEVVSMLLWFVMEDVAFYHLGASSKMGYEMGASFALFDASIEALRDRVEYMILGGTSGTGDKHDGLARFKKGWATGSEPSLLCGSILDVPAYVELGGFFPAYRSAYE